MFDPATSLSFDVTVDGIDLGAFTECDGLGAEFDVFEYQEGGENGFVHRLPGRLKFQTIKLSRAVDHRSNGLAAWFSTFKRHVVRGTATIVAFDGNRHPVAQWTLIGVYPMRWTGPSLNAGGNDVAKESLELAHNGFVS
jgi:phage tail-like protein